VDHEPSTTTDPSCISNVTGLGFNAPSTPQ
jgi:hypothetical protein